MKATAEQWMEDNGISLSKPTQEENFWSVWTHDHLTNEIVEGQGKNMRTALRDIAGKLGVEFKVSDKKQEPW